MKYSNRVNILTIPLIALNELLSQTSKPSSILQVVSLFGAFVPCSNTLAHFSRKHSLVISNLGRVVFPEIAQDIEFFYLYWSYLVLHKYLITTTVSIPIDVIYSIHSVNVNLKMIAFQKCHCEETSPFRISTSPSSVCQPNTAVIPINPAITYTLKE